MLKLEYENERGNSLTFGVQTNACKLISWSGLSEAEIEPQTSTGFAQHGVAYYGSLLSPRTIAVTVVVQRQDAAQLVQAREQMQAVFNPLLKGVLKIAPLGGAFKYAADCVVIETPTINGQGSDHYQMYDISFYVPSGVIRSYEKHVLKMEGFVGGLKFPLRFPIRFASRGNIADIEYTGHLASPVAVEFWGPATNPMVQNRVTGKYIELTIALGEGERVVVNNDPSGPQIYKVVNGEYVPAFHLINPDCDLGDFNLQLGANGFSYVAASGAPQAYLFWHDLYAGV